MRVRIVGSGSRPPRLPRFSGSIRLVSSDQPTTSRMADDTALMALVVPRSSALSAGSRSSAKRQPIGPCLPTS